MVASSRDGPARSRWTADLRTPSPFSGSESGEDDAPGAAGQSRDDRLRTELDLARREDHAVVPKPNPFTIASAAGRAGVNPLQRGKATVFKQPVNRQKAAETGAGAGGATSGPAGGQGKVQAGKTAVANGQTGKITTSLKQAKPRTQADPKHPLRRPTANTTQKSGVPPTQATSGPIKFDKIPSHAAQQPDEFPILQALERQAKKPPPPAPAPTPIHASALVRPRPVPLKMKRAVPTAESVPPALKTPTSNVRTPLKLAQPSPRHPSTARSHLRSSSALISDSSGNEADDHAGLCVGSRKTSFVTAAGMMSRKVDPIGHMQDLRLGTEDQGGKAALDRNVLGEPAQKRQRTSALQGKGWNGNEASALSLDHDPLRNLRMPTSPGPDDINLEAPQRYEAQTSLFNARDDRNDDTLGSPGRQKHDQEQYEPYTPQHHYRPTETFFEPSMQQDSPPAGRHPFAAPLTSASFQALRPAKRTMSLREQQEATARARQRASAAIAKLNERGVDLGAGRGVRDEDLFQGVRMHMGGKGQGYSQASKPQTTSQSRRHREESPPHESWSTLPAPKRQRGGGLFQSHDAPPVRRSALFSLPKQMFESTGRDDPTQWRVGSGGLGKRKAPSKLFGGWHSSSSATATSSSGGYSPEGKEEAHVVPLKTRITLFTPSAPKSSV